MPPDNNSQVDEQTSEVHEASRLHQVTPLSKYLAMTLFIILPFVGGWIGYMYAPEKVVEVERVIVEEVEVSEDFFETNDFSRDTLTLIEATELYKGGSDASQSTSYHIFHNDTHMISVPGDCKVLLPEYSGFRDGLDFEERDDYEVLSHVLCTKSAGWIGTETLLLARKNPIAGPQRSIIHYSFQDCAMSSDDCEPYGPPITLQGIVY